MKPKFQFLRNKLLILFLTLILISIVDPRTNFIQALFSPTTTFSTDPPTVTDPVLTPGSSSMPMYSPEATMTTFKVEPATSTGGIGATIILQVNVYDAVDLWGWQVFMTWDPVVLGFSDLIFGDFLAGQPEGTAQMKQIDYVSEGWLMCTETTFGTYPGVGNETHPASGWLMSVTFEVLSIGETTINIDSEYTFWQDSALETYGDQPDEMIKENGYFSNTAVTQYQLTIQVDGSGTTNPAPGSYMYDEGTQVDVDAIPDSGWMLDHWELDGVDVGSADPYRVTMDADYTLKAFFVTIPPTQYQLTIQVDGSGTTNPAPGSHMYDEGTQVDVDAIPDSGWMLDHWELDGVDVGSADPYRVTMDADYTLKAFFVTIPATQIYIDPSTVTANPGEYFTINISIADVTDLNSWGIKVGWPLGLLEVDAENITEGAFLKQGGTTAFAKKTFTDYIDVGCVLLGGSSGVSGSGTLATVTFKVLETGSSSLELYDTTLLDSTITEIPHTLQHGYFYTTWPVADFDYSPNPLDNPGHPIQGETITFNASSSYDPDGGTISLYEWNFGDGTSGTGQIVTHAYDTAGSYPVTLTVTDDDEETYDESRSILVLLHDISVVEVVVDPTEVVAGDPIIINATVLNNGSISETFNVTVYYDDTPIDTQTYMGLSPEENITLTFMWNTGGVPSNEYTIKAYTYLVDTATLESRPDLETNMEDNTFIDGTVNILTALVHDVAMTSITIPTKTVQGETVTIGVNVSNIGAFDETFDVEVTYDTTLIDSQSVTLVSGGSTTLTFSWDTTGVPLGTYTITAEVVLAADEVPANNIATATIEITTIVHDIAILNIVLSTHEVVVGGSVTIDVSLENQGTAAETFDVTVTYDSTVVDTHSVTLDAGATSVESFNWETTGVADGTYTISAEASVVSGETDTADNTFTDGTVTLLPQTIDHPVEVGGVTFHVTTESNSTISDFTFNQTLKQISFNVTGPEGTVGFCNVTIPKDLLGGTLTVSINGTPIPYEFTENATHYSLYFTYTLSTYVIQITGTTVATPPIAFFTYSPSEPLVDETVTFNATGSYDPDGTIASYSWDFGDGTTATGDIATHAYAAADTYTVTLTVTDNDGLSSTTAATVAVSLLPMDTTPPTITINEPVTKEYLHSEMITLDFSAVDTESGVASITATLNGMTVENGEAIELYTLPLGQHTLTVTAVDNVGNSDTKTVAFNVIATIDSLITLVEKFYDLGYINDDDFKDGLLSKLYAAKAKIEMGQEREAKNYLKTARNILSAFINQVKADDHVAAEAASILISDVEYVQNNL